MALGLFHGEVLLDGMVPGRKIGTLLGQPEMHDEIYPVATSAPGRSSPFGGHGPEKRAPEIRKEAPLAPTIADARCADLLYADPVHLGGVAGRVSCVLRRCMNSNDRCQQEELPMLS